jgi:hypothetical protein
MSASNGNRLRSLLLALTLLAALWPGGAATAQDDRLIRFDRYEVLISRFDTGANTFQVYESYTLTAERGPFRRGARSVNTAHMDGIEGLTVYEGDSPLQGVETCGDAPGTFCLQQGGEQAEILFNFRAPLESGQSRKIDVVYTVRGRLRRYTDGDRLHWTPIHTGAIEVRSGTVTISLPEGLNVLSATIAGNRWPVTTEAGRAVYTLPPDIGIVEPLEINVQFTHDGRLAAPVWQPAYDRAGGLATEESGPTMPLIALAVVLAGALAILALAVVKNRRRPATDADYSANSTADA